MKIIRSASIRSKAAASGKFTAGVWHDEPLTARRPGGMRGHRFTYPPQGRSYWHVHEGEQALMVVSGRGWVQRWGEAAVELLPGDVVHVEPGEKHWHGAAPDSAFVHWAVTASGGTQWEEEVSDEQYRGATG